MDSDALAALRREYGIGTLSEQDAAAAPHLQFAVWLDDAVRAGLAEPNAMVVSTTDPAGQPSSRSVLLKGFDHESAGQPGEIGRTPFQLLHDGEGFPEQSAARKVFQIGRLIAGGRGERRKHAVELVSRFA